MLLHYNSQILLQRQQQPLQDIEPYGGINLQGFSASLTNEFSEPNYVVRLVKYAGQPHYLGTNNICDIQTWVDAINKAATEANQVSKSYGGEESNTIYYLCVVFIFFSPSRD